MKNIPRIVFLVTLFAMVFSLGACSEKKTRSVTFEGPKKKTEIKVETTEKNKDKEKDEAKEKEKEKDEAKNR